ncbi:MAG: M1 family metallopeptidase [Gemmatimonadota bacterium]|nr:M1 family metallopeptidase [Gemmatimonadota bacterium]
MTVTVAPSGEQAVVRRPAAIPFDRSAWPAPSPFRTATGEPGPSYWQQRADYSIAVTLDTTAKRVSGTVQVRYTNNSPDTLRVVWLQLDQNLYRPGSKGSAKYSAYSRWGVRGFVGGYDLSQVTVNGVSVTPHVDDTMMRLDLPQPLAPRGGVLAIHVAYGFNVPGYGSDRMARDGTLYEIAQWYPRMAVYDDINGWNIDPYLGQGEFYLEYGDIEYAVTAPAGYTIAGTGVLQNPEEVLTRAQRDRLERAAKSSDQVGIILSSEARARPTPGTKTWRFRAERVRDVAWAGAPDFRWEATSWNGVLCQAYFQQDRTRGAWDRAAEMTQWSIRTYSERFFPYPYPQATSVAGPVGGMEYPMFVMVEYGSNGDPDSVFGTIDHELGHQWYPMLVGSNERRYAWQDEGFTTYLNAFSSERRYPRTNAYEGPLQSWRRIVADGIDAPLMTAPDQLELGALGVVAYEKPALALLMLRRQVLGAELFDRAFREYTRRWAFRHPTPADFFRTVEHVAERRLDWFWRDWWYGTGTLDLAISGVTERAGATGRTVELQIARTTDLVFPVAVRLAYEDGTTQDLTFPVDVWGDQPTVRVTAPARGRVIGARLWPDGLVPDWNAANDIWGNAPKPDPRRAVTIPKGGAGR